MNAQQLRNSILQEAIEGRLVPQNPNDEPASVLLQQIREEKKRLVKEGKLKKKDLEEKPISEDEIPFEIPESWEWVRLSQLFNFIDYRGSTPTKLDSGIPLVTAKNVKRGYNDYSIKDYISAEEYESRKSRGISKRGDLLFTTEAPLGNVSVADLDVFSAGQRLITLQSYSCNNTLIMFFMLSDSFQKSLIEKKTGTTVAGIKASKLKDILIPLPPLAEQHRIVAKIEELMPKVEEYGKAQEALDKLNAELPEKLKKSILQEAIEGRLVPQDPNDEPASVLLQRIREEKKRLVKEGKLKKGKNGSIIYRTDDGQWMEHFDDKKRQDVCIDDEIPFDIPDSWEWVRLHSIATNSLGKTLNGGKTIGLEKPYLCTINVYWNKIDLSKVKSTSFSEMDCDKYQLCKGDLLICEGGDFGRSAVWDFDKEMYYQNALHRVTFFGGLNPYLYMYYIELCKAAMILDELAKGMTIKHLTQDALYSMVFPLPPLAEQHRIVEKIEQVLGEIDKLKA